jgi:signal transduction histidine kinase
MRRRIVAVGLAAAAIALLGVLVFQSRSVSIDAHLAHHTALSELSHVAEDFGTLVSDLNAAWQENQIPREGVQLLAARLASSPERIGQHLKAVPGSASQEKRLSNSHAGFTTMVQDTSVLIGEILDEQTTYGESVLFLRDSGPRIVQEMRNIRLDRAASDTFQLVVGTLDFAKTDSSVQEFELRRLLVTLGRDQRIDANMPVEVNQLHAAITTILDTKAPLTSKLNQLGDTPVPLAARRLAAAQESLYRATLLGVDQARTLLAVYALLLLAAAGFIAYRLNASYRDLNLANTELEGANLSLEARVAERTKELSGALQELKESQVQLVQAEKMSSLGQLVAGISHEINTPLLYLTNNAVLIQERLEMLKVFIYRIVNSFNMSAGDFADRAEYQANFINALKGIKRHLAEEEVEDSLREAESLLNDCIDGLTELTHMARSLKDFSRLDRAPIDSFDVNEGIEKTLVIAKNALKHKATVHKHYGELPPIECSPSQINQVFLNIITNAAQAIDDTGDVMITSRRRDDDHISITITDSGCGIAPENLDKIRDPFFTTKEVGAGTGLGLSIVDEIIRSHGGELLIESQLGKGSSFTIVLPIKQSASPEQPAEQQQPDETEAAERALSNPIDIATAV